MKSRILIITDGPAALLHTPRLLEALRREGCTVKVAATGYPGASALEFISETGWSVLSGHPCIAVDALTPEMLRWAEAVVLSPVSPAVLAVFQRGNALKLLTDAGRPVLAVPTSLPGDERPDCSEWLKQLPPGSSVLFPEEPEQITVGAMGALAVAPVETVVEAIARTVTEPRLAGVTTLMTAGPTCEDIDPVRFVSNRSSGKMGLALALAAVRRGAHVRLVHGPMSIPLPRVPGLEYLPVRSAKDMHQTVLDHWDSVKLAVLSAAVADFTPDHYAPEKIKKVGAEGLELKLLRTSDILKELGERENKPFLVGFAAESDDVEINALTKLRKKHCDMICANDIRQPGCGFAVDTNRVVIYHNSGEVTALPKLSKTETAERIIDEICRRMK